MNTFIQQGCVKMVKRELFLFQIDAVVLTFFIHQRILIFFQFSPKYFNSII